jgi:hypothetical protein
MRVEIWTPGQPIGHFTAEEAIAIQGEYTGPMVAVIDEHGGAAIIQPMNPNTGENWASEEEATAFGMNYINPPQTEQPTERPDRRSLRYPEDQVIETTATPEPTE